MSTESRFQPQLGSAIARFELGEKDVEAIGALADRIIQESPDAPLEERLKRVTLLAHELPESIREALVDFRLTNEPLGGFVVAGLPINELELGATPPGLRTEAQDKELRRADAMLYLIASLLGDPFSHNEIQEGRLILDVCPARGNEDTQLASSSSGGLAWHIEDAFYDFRADWLLLMCLRNTPKAATTFARVQDVVLSEDVSATLFENKFIIEPDSSHVAGDQAPAPRQVAVLSGDRRAPFVRIDPEFMPRDLEDPVAENALTTVIEALEAKLQDVVLEPGQVLIIDNYRAVHGRRPFDPSYDGKDRWLRVLNVTADLRKSEGLRTGSHGRALSTL